jgi:hypothetical protein
MCIAAAICALVLEHAMRALPQILFDLRIPMFAPRSMPVAVADPWHDISLAADRDAAQGAATVLGQQLSTNRRCTT